MPDSVANWASKSCRGSRASGSPIRKCLTVKNTSHTHITAKNALRIFLRADFFLVLENRAPGAVNRLLQGTSCLSRLFKFPNNSPLESDIQAGGSFFGGQVSPYTAGQF